MSTYPIVSCYLSPEARERGLRFSPPRQLDAGFDLPALEDTVIPPNGLIAVRTGIHLAIPEGYVGLVRDRSSVALRGGVTTAGVIDASYRGEIKVVMHNLGTTPLEFKVGDRIAQIVIVPHLVADSVELVESPDALGQTTRGAGGFGSTGS